jgi:hypothetical protein
MLRVLLAVALSLVCAVIATAQVVKGSAPPCPIRVDPISGTPSAVTSLVQTVTRTVPRVYSSMRNQAGRGAWRGYVIGEVISLNKTYPATAERARLWAAATARCGARTATASWAVRLGFPNAQSVPSSHGTAFFVHGPTGWRFWFRLP